MILSIPCDTLCGHTEETLKLTLVFRTLSAGDVNEDNVNSLHMASLLRQPSTWSTDANDLLTTSCFG